MAFFITMKKIYFILLAISLVIPFYNYDQDDWVIIYEPDNIISITEDSFNIYFLADNGIFSYDYMDEYFYYNTELSYDLPKDNYRYIYYHPIIDYFFIITDNEILYRSSVSFHWNSIKLTSLNLFSFNSIDKIGFSNEFLIINSNDNYMKFDLYTMRFIDNDISNIGFIDWLSDFYNDINLSQFYSMDNAIIGSNYITDNSKKNHIVNSYYYDKNEDLWIGMDTGSIYKVNYFSYNIERVDIGPRVKKYQVYIIMGKINGIFLINILEGLEIISIIMILSIYYQYGMNLIIHGYIFLKMMIF